MKPKAALVLTTLFVAGCSDSHPDRTLGAHPRPELMHSDLDTDPARSARFAARFSAERAAKIPSRGRGEANEFGVGPRAGLFISDQPLPPGVAAVLLADATMPNGVLLVISRKEVNTAALFAGINALAIVTRGGEVPFGPGRVEVMRSGTIRGEDGSAQGAIPRGLTDTSAAQERIESLVGRATRLTPLSIPRIGAGNLVDFGATK